MTGPEHWREAERHDLDARANERPIRPTQMPRAALAQVHATLALAAATAFGASPHAPRQRTRAEWDHATGVTQ